jgi:hypothetical protein
MSKNASPLKRALDITGWIGVAMVLGAFLAVTVGWVQSEDLLYGALNAFGALAIIGSSYIKRDFQPVVLNVLWLLIAIFGIFRAIAAIS